MFLQESTCPISALFAIPIIPKTIHDIAELKRDAKTIELRIQNFNLMKIGQFRTTDP